MTRPVAVWLLLSAIWGSTWLFMKLGLQDLPPLTFAGYRFTLAILPLALLVRIRNVPLPRGLADWVLMVGSGVLTFTVAYGLVFWGQQYVSSGLAALLFATFPFFGLMVAHRWLPAERMTPARVLGVVVGISGVGIVLSNQLQASGTIAVWGGTAIVLAALVSAYADVWIKRSAGHLDPMLLTLVQMVSGVVPLLAAGWVLEGDPRGFKWTPMAVMSILYLSLVGSALAFVLLYWLIRRMAVTKTMLLTLVTPLIAVLLGVVLLDEALTWRTASGGAAILLGLGLTVRSSGPPPPAFNRRAHRAGTDRNGIRPIT